MMNERVFEIGQVVQSLAGRDRGNFFIVVGFEGERFVLVADGIYRRVENPKKKNLKHVKPIHYIDAEVRHAVLNAERLNNAKVRIALEKFQQAFTEDLTKGEK